MKEELQVKEVDQENLDLLDRPVQEVQLDHQVSEDLMVKLESLDNLVFKVKEVLVGKQVHLDHLVCLDHLVKLENLAPRDLEEHQVKLEDVAQMELQVNQVNLDQLGRQDHEDRLDHLAQQDHQELQAVVGFYQ